MTEANPFEAANVTFADNPPVDPLRRAAGNFVTTWCPELGRNAVGVTLGIEDDTEANPRVMVKWLHDLSVELVRSEYLDLD